MHKRLHRSDLLQAFVCTVVVVVALRSFAAAPATNRQTFMVPMRDGTKLATDVYLPEGDPKDAAHGPFSVVLMRTPYNKNGGNPRDANSRGYALVMQDTRGRFASEGENLPFHGDGWSGGKLDGYDTCEWIGKQKWCNGKIGTTGGSALGITQLGLAGAKAPHVAAQQIIVASPSMYHDGVFPGGVWKKAMIEDWLRTTNHSPDSLKYWQSHPKYDAFWKERDLNTRWRNCNVPAMHVGGWYDLFAQGTIDSFLGYQTKGGPNARGKQRLIMGPWTHGIGIRNAGELQYPQNASAPPNRAMDPWRWFDFHLKGEANGVDKEPAVHYYVMGDPTAPGAPGNEWRTADTWPPPATDTPFYFNDFRTLKRTKGEVGSIWTYTYDPKDPCPTTGGPQLTLPAGPRDQSKIEARPDVVYFTSDSLTAPLEVTGRVHAKLFVSSDAPDTDFVVKLCDAYPDGRSMLVCEGLLRARFREGFHKEVFMQAEKVYALDVDLWSTSIIFNKGHRIRVDVTSSSAPGYDPNPNTGEPFRASDKTRTARNTVHLGGKTASQVVLPIMTKP